MLKLVPDCVKTEKCVNMLKMLFSIRYVSDQYKTQPVFGNIILEDGGTLEYPPDCYKKQISNKVLHNQPHALELVQACYKSPEK